MLFNKLKHLSIYKTRHFNILTRLTETDLKDFDIIKDAKFALNHKECFRFLKIESRYIEILKIQGDIKDELLEVEYLQLKVTPFVNLKKIIYYQMAVTNEDVILLAQNCPKLEILNIIKCFCEHFHTLVPGVNFNISNICGIKKLQEIKIEAEKPPGVTRELKLKYLKYLLANLENLKSLEFKNFTIICKDYEKTDRGFIPENIWNLQVLNVGIITKDFWSTFTEYLRCCPSLRELTLTLEDSAVNVNIKIIDILSKCYNLEILCLENCNLEVYDFMPLEPLQELTLISCQGFTYENLQQILGGLKLKTFKMINTRIEDINNCIYISPTVESITIDSIYFSEISEIFQNSINKFTGLLKLYWHKGDINHNWIIEKCPQLQELHITNPYLLPPIVYSLKSLQELTLTSCHGLSWDLLKMLLRDLNLKRLNINTDKVIVDGRKSMKSLKITTSLEELTIPYEIFLSRIRNWIDLLDVNEDMSLIIYGKDTEILNLRLISLLLAEESIQKRCERIRICGFNLELKDFEKNSILKAFVILHINTNFFKMRKMPFTLEL